MPVESSPSSPDPRGRPRRTAAGMSLGGVAGRRRRRTTLCIDDYDCVGFDLDHTLVRYDVGPMIQLEYDLLADFLVRKKGYDPAIGQRSLDRDRDFVCKGLTLDCERGNLLRLAADGFILRACHGTRRMSDADIERVYGRCRKRHPGPDYTQHLKEVGPQNMVDFGQLLHSFMDYFDIAAPLLCARIVDVVDRINNGGKPMDEYFFWPDVQEGLKSMYMRTNFATDQGGYFPEMKAHPERYILKRGDHFREWLGMLRANGKYLYVITGSHYDFANHVASYALGDDWKDLFDIVIFFARKPSFFSEQRPFWRLDGPNEVESFEGWEDLETGDYYSQGNWKDLNEFFEYCTEWEPSTSLYFGDNVLQDVLAPKKFTTTVDSVAVCEDLLAEGMIGKPPSHPHADVITSKAVWGSYFFSPDPRRVWRQDSVLSRASSFRSKLQSVTPSGSGSPEQQREEEIKRALSLRRACTAAGATSGGVGGQRSAMPHSASSSSLKSDSPPAPALRPLQQQHRAPRLGSLPPRSSLDSAAGRLSRPETPLRSREENAAKGGTPPDGHAQQQQQQFSQLPTGPQRINTLWGVLIRDFAKMCIPDLDVLTSYPVDYQFPAFSKSKKTGEMVSSGFFPSDPCSLHTSIPVYGAS